MKLATVATPLALIASTVLAQKPSPSPPAVFVSHRVTTAQNSLTLCSSQVLSVFYAKYSTTLTNLDPAASTSLASALRAQGASFYDTPAGTAYFALTQTELFTGTQTPNSPPVSSSIEAFQSAQRSLLAAAAIATGGATIVTSTSLTAKGGSLNDLHVFASLYH